MQIISIYIIHSTVYSAKCILIWLKVVHTTQYAVHNTHNNVYVQKVKTKFHMRLLCPSSHMRLLCPSSHMRLLCSSSHMRFLCPSSHMRLLCPSSHMRLLCPSSHMRLLCPSSYMRLLCRSSHKGCYLLLAIKVAMSL